EALQVADATVHEQPDDALRPGREVGLAVGRRPGTGDAGAGHAVAVEHGGQRQAGEGHAEVGQERPAMDAVSLAVAAPGGPHGEPQRTVMKSLWFRSACTRFARARSTSADILSVPARAFISFRARSHSACSAAVGGEPRTVSNAALMKAVSVALPSLSLRR